MATATMLTPQQVRYYETFGYLKLPGLFRDEIDQIVTAFDDVFAQDEGAKLETYFELHGERRRVLIPQFVDRSPVLAALREDPRTVETVTTLLGSGYEYAESDGNILDCDTSWHCDIFGAPIEVRHLKLLFYLDPLGADSGALRVIPGSTSFRETFATNLRSTLFDPKTIEPSLGVDAADVPSWPVPTEPGDVIALDFRTVHASFAGAEGRRLFTINFSEAATTAAQPNASAQ
jgi:ectoine hydroxylase-related dioxygenase (phytanoyl-CoA dioxygenase family)